MVKALVGGGGRVDDSSISFLACSYWHSSIAPCCGVIWPLGTILLTWINFNPSKDKWLHPLQIWDEISYPFLKIQRYNRWRSGMDK